MDHKSPDHDQTPSQGKPETHPELGLYAALKVVYETREVREILRARDPKALEQVWRALANAEAQAQAPVKPEIRPPAGIQAPDPGALEAFVEDPELDQQETMTFVNDCGERNGVPYEPYRLTRGEGFNMVECRGLNIGVIFQPNELEGTKHLAFMGSGLFCGAHDNQDAAIAAVQVGYFG